MIKNLFLIILGVSIIYHSSAQKVPDIQPSNQWLSTVKIDGNHTEWPQPLNAFNKTMHCRYSLSNDDKNLYLAIKSDRVGKILSGGITIIVNKSEVTFPFNNRRDRRFKKNWGPLPAGVPRYLKDFKEIHVKGISGIKDSLISLYNQHGIKVMISEYEDKADVKWYDYELCIPLKYLANSATSKSINYTIKFNGIVSRPSGGKVVPIPGKSQREMMEIEESLADGSRVSQLTGKYILAIKP